MRREEQGNAGAWRHSTPATEVRRPLRRSGRGGKTPCRQRRRRRSRPRFGGDGGARSQVQMALRLGLHRRGSFIRVRPSSPGLSGFGCAPVAQLDRASDYESEGWRFDSFRARHFSQPYRSSGPSFRPALSFANRDRPSHCGGTRRVVGRPNRKNSSAMVFWNDLRGEKDLRGSSIVAGPVGRLPWSFLTLPSYRMPWSMHCAFR